MAIHWIVNTGSLRFETDAETAADACDVLRGQEPRDFGIIVAAQPAGRPEDDRVVVRTTYLFGQRWGDKRTARRMIKSIVAMGGPDTSAADLAEARP